MNPRRRRLIALGAGVLAAPLPSLAQQQRSKVTRIGFIATSNSATDRGAFNAGLRDLGYVEGKNISIEFRWMEGKYERLPGLAAELVQMKVDVILASGTPAVQAAKQATTTIPIVMVRAGDPVGSGLVASLARPGGNVTGLSSINVDLMSKYVELLRAAIPRLSRVTVLVNRNNPIHAIYLKRIQAAEKTLDVKVSSAAVSTAGEIEAALALMKQERAEGLIVLSDGLFLEQARRIAELAAQHRLPTIFANQEGVDRGGLMSYSVNITQQFYRAATYIDKILKGTKPADLPVEQPTKFEFLINLKTAKAIGLTIPQQALLQADKVIE